MQLVREFKVENVEFFRTNNLWMFIRSGGNSPLNNHNVNLQFNQFSCAGFDIPMSADIIGRVLIVTLDSRQLSGEIRETGRREVRMFSTNELADNELAFEELIQTETIKPWLFHISPQRKVEKVRRVIKLSKHGFGDPRRETDLPKGSFQLEFDLSEEEYRDCSNLPVETVFALSCHLK